VRGITCVKRDSDIVSEPSLRDSSFVTIKVPKQDRSMHLAVLSLTQTGPHPYSIPQPSDRKQSVTLSLTPLCHLTVLRDQTVKNYTKNVSRTFALLPSDTECNFVKQ